jgi:hypothetical protein
MFEINAHAPLHLSPTDNLDPSGLQPKGSGIYFGREDRIPVEVPLTKGGRKLMPPGVVEIGNVGGWNERHGRCRATPPL